MKKYENMNHFKTEKIKIFNSFAKSNIMIPI